MNPSTLWYTAWAIAISFSFVGFVIFAQQGKGTGKNTWFFKNKVWLGVLCVAIVVLSFVWLYFHNK